MPSIMMCDDQVLFTEAILKALGEREGITVIGSASSGQECIDLIESGVIPDILILDISMPKGLSGYEVASNLSKDFPQIKIVILSMLTDEHAVKAMIRLGAKAFVYKFDDLRELETAIKTVYSGGEYYPSDFFFQSDEIELIKNTPIEWAEKITNRELTAIKLAATNLPNKLIAHKMGVTEAAINKKIKALSKKTKSKTKIGIILFLKKVGILD